MRLAETLIGLLFLVVGILLFRGAIKTRLCLEKEIKGGRVITLGNFLPYWNADDFTDRGNLLRKKYNAFYYALFVYSILLFFYVRTSD